METGHSEYKAEATLSWPFPLRQLSVFFSSVPSIDKAVRTQRGGKVEREKQK